jgi:hypothetical protein
MATFAFVGSLVEVRSTIHAAGCRCVELARSKRNPVATTEAETAAEAAKWFSTKFDFSERGLPEPEICKCAK